MENHFFFNLNLLFRMDDIYKKSTISSGDGDRW